MPSVLGDAQSGRQPFAAAATTGVYDRPSASCHHSLPESVSPSPAPHIRLIGALHKFLQSRNCIILRAALQARPLSRHLLYATTSFPAVTTNGVDASQQPPQRHEQHKQHKPLTCGNFTCPCASSKPGCYSAELQSSGCQLVRVKNRCPEFSTGCSHLWKLFALVWSCRQHGIRNAPMVFMHKQHSFPSSRLRLAVNLQPCRTRLVRQGCS